jgi:cell division protein FtsQ
MSRTRAATPAGKRRTSGRRASGSGERGRTKGSPRTAPKPRARTTPKRSSPKRARRAPARRTRRRAWSRPRPLRASRRAARTTSWRFRLGVVFVLAAVVGAAYFLWFRDSSLVAIDEVEVHGLTSLTDPGAAADLERAASGMTTLHVELEELGMAVAGYPTIKSLSASPSFPDGLEITVVERPPVAVAGDAGVPVAADGTLLPGVETGKQDLPAIDVSVGEDVGTLEGEGADQAIVLGAAPEPLVPVIDRSTVSDGGIVVELSNGIELRFGDSSRAEAKWQAAARILADPALTSLTYVDLRIPDRPAVGGAVTTDAASAIPAPG